MTQQKKTIFRFAIIFIVITLGFIAVIVKIIYIQTAEREKLLKIASRQVSRDRTIEPNRGNIYDCNGRLLAGSAPLYYIYMDTRVQALHEKKGARFNLYIDSISESLSTFFGDRTKQEYKRYITNGYNNGAYRLKLYPKRLTYSELKAVKQMPLFNQGPYKSGLIVESRYQRIHPFGSLARRSLGSIYGETGKGNSGLEMQYERYLHGREGRQVTKMIDTRVVSEENIEAVDGLDIVSTIDSHLQDVVESNLRYILSTKDADWGCCVLMEVKTGKIKAISNLGRTQEGKYIEDRNYAVSRIEPGSTFKTYALMAALDDGKVKITDTIDVERGLWYYEKAKQPIQDSHTYRDKSGNPLSVTRFTVEEILATSSNVGLSKIVTTAYEKNAARFVDKLDRMGVRDSIPFDIPGTQQPYITVPKDGETLARMAFGYFVELAPIDILTFYNAIANNGKMIRPYLVEQIQDNGETVKHFTTSTLTSSICKSSTLKDIRKCLEAVVWNNDFGTAAISPWGSKKAQSDIVHIAGKTGTAQIFENGHYQRKHHRTLFCGYFPMEEPRYTCICVIQQKAFAQYDAGMDCGGTVRRIAEKTMAYHGSKTDHYPRLVADTLPTPPQKRPMPKLTNKSIVPNVVGMGAKDAVYTLEQTGVLVSVHGRGRVVSQSIPAGSKVEKGSIVNLELK